MKLSVIVNSYNYEDYIAEGLNSVLGQTRPADEIIIVDDGSTDRSPEILQEYADRHDHIRLIRKENGGQLSSFNEAAGHVSGDVVFFLDSDDAWKPTYLEKIAGIYKEHPVDFVFCSLQNFGSDDRIRRAYRTDRDLGYTVALTWYMKAFIGSQTSSLSIRRELLEKIYPVPFEEEWRVSADFSLVAGASILGARKYYCSEPLVLYRMHHGNAHKEAKARDEYKFKTLYKRSALIEYFAHKAHLTREIMDQLLCLEIKTRKDPMDRKTFLRYLRIVFYTEKAWFKKLADLMKLLFAHLAMQGK